MIRVAVRQWGEQAACVRSCRTTDDDRLGVSGETSLTLKSAKTVKMEGPSYNSVAEENSDNEHPCRACAARAKYLGELYRAGSAS